MNIAEYRREYTLAGLNESDLLPDPMDQFQKMVQGGRASANHRTHAMVSQPRREPLCHLLALCCSNVSTEPDLLFSPIYEKSRKARELEENPNVSLTFPWVALERQVTVIGRASKVSREQSADYFKMRPVAADWARGCQTQSQSYSRTAISRRETARTGDEVPERTCRCRRTGAGILLRPDQIEFWQGRPNRLHDRLRYSRQPDHTWKIERLSP